MKDDTPHEASLRITFPLGFVIFFSVLNGVMFNVAVPDIASEFGLMPSEVSWVMTGYIVVFALGALVYGKLADLYSVRGLITLGLLLLNLGSLVGLLTVCYPMLIAARILQASGGAAIPALAMLVATRYFPSRLKGSLLGVIASTVAAAAGVGPILGGFVAGALNWRYLFVFTLLTIFTLPALRRLLPGERGPERAFDAAGAVLISGGMAALLFSVTLGVWWASLLGAGLLALFCAHVARSEEPFIRPGLFANHPYRNTIIATFLSMGTVFGMMFMAPIMLRELNGLGSMNIGLAMFPGALCAALLGRAGGRMADRKGSVPVAHLGMALLVAGYVLLSTVSGGGPRVVAACLVVSYVGFAFVQSSMPHTASSALPREHAGIGMGIYNLFFFASGAFSAAGIGRLLDMGSMGFCVNPLNACGPAWIYSNIFVLLAGMAALAWVVVWRTFGRGG
jgi:DHA2 family metal-tetracycline-proton antiporter-like MFS transporter